MDIPFIQTQTPALQVVEASVLTDNVVSSKSESVQVDSLLPPPPSPSPSPAFQVQQASPPPESADLPPQSSPSCPAPGHHSQAPSDIGSAQAFVRIFDTPSEVVQEELKDIEMNTTIHSLDVENGNQHAFERHFNLDEQRETEECLNQDVEKEYNEGSLFQKHPAVQKRPTSSTSQSLDKDKELNKATPLCSIPSKIDIDYQNVTMDKLFEEFCSGRISLEDFYQMSSNIPGEVKEETACKVDKKESILALEQQVSEAAQSITESQHIVEKVKCLIQEPEVTEDRYSAQNCNSNEKFVSNFSHRHQDSMVLSKKIKESAGWQEALSVYRNQGKTDTLLHFLDTVDFENITSDMIDEIIQCENSIWPNEKWKMSQPKANDDSTFIGQKRSTTRISNKMLPRMRSNEMSKRKDLDHWEAMQNEVDLDTTASDLMITEDRMKMLSSGSESPGLHLNLAYTR